jgi:hypothetical protein
VPQEEHQEALQGQQLATMRALLEQQVLPETAAVLATADKNAREIPSSGKERVVPKILVPLVKVSAVSLEIRTFQHQPGLLPRLTLPLGTQLPSLGTHKGCSAQEND